MNPCAGEGIELEGRYNDKYADFVPTARTRPEESMLKRLLSTNNDVSFTILRFILGVVFFAHGAQKMLGWFGGYNRY